MNYMKRATITSTEVWRDENWLQIKQQICVKRWGGRHLTQIKTWNKHEGHFFITCFKNLIAPSSAAAVDARVLGKENVYNRGENCAVTGLLLSSILIAATLKARRVPLTVAILIYVIAFSQGGAMAELATALCATHSQTADMLQWRLSSVGGLSSLPSEMQLSLCKPDLHLRSKCCLSGRLLDV